AAPAATSGHGAAPAATSGHGAAPAATSGHGPHAGLGNAADFLPSFPDRTCAARLSRMTRELISAVCSAQSYGGEHSTTSIPASPG
ncbi:MAG: hypothetical protein ACXWZI_07890, partial [Mycobacterium sp.]